MLAQQSAGFVIGHPGRGPHFPQAFSQMKPISRGLFTKSTTLVDSYNGNRSEVATALLHLNVTASDATPPTAMEATYKKGSTI